MAESYAHPDILVSPEWVEAHRNDPKVRIVESDEDAALYFQGHVPGAVEIGWHLHLQDQTIRDYISTDAFEKLCSAAGIAEDTTVVFYGDNSNWWACYALWAFKLFGHRDCRILDGGYKFWSESKLPLVKEVPSYPPTNYKAKPIDQASIRALRDAVLVHVKAHKALVDVRSTKEFTGEMLHMENYPQEGALRAGHIPGAKSVPWSRAVQDNGKFKSAQELKAIYEGEAGLKPSDDVVVYCRIGERSSLTWFVLKYLLGYPTVRNYDGSWTEWGNLIGAPVAKGS
jgi:thiosulfate/3-mercaptopyruvate sulfurtransferase